MATYQTVFLKGENADVVIVNYINLFEGVDKAFMIQHVNWELSDYDERVIIGCSHISNGHGYWPIFETHIEEGSPDDNKIEYCAWKGDYADETVEGYGGGNMSHLFPDHTPILLKGRVWTRGE